MYIRILHKMVASDFHHQPIFLLIICCIVIQISAKEIGKAIHEDLSVASSIPVKAYKVQSAANNKHGYPYAIAPTLTPLINSRSDSDDDDEDQIPVALPKTYVGKLPSDGSEATPKKNAPKKLKTFYTYNANRRSGYADEEEQKLKRYKEPKYRNLDELESRFRPRRIDLDVPYSEYYRPKSQRPQVSHRDPYLSPSKEPADSFYPIPKTRSYSTPYKQSGRSSGVYGSGRYEYSQPYYGEHTYSGYVDNGYEGPSKYADNDEPYNYQEDYTIESNKPITGDIRKRLLDYAGASDLYEGEPDYLRQVALNKHKYGHIGNDYYAYGGPEYKKSYRDFPYVESKISLIKKSKPS